MRIVDQEEGRYKEGIETDQPVTLDFVLKEEYAGHDIGDHFPNAEGLGISHRCQEERDRRHEHKEDGSVTDQRVADN